MGPHSEFKVLRWRAAKAGRVWWYSEMTTALKSALAKMPEDEQAAIRECQSTLDESIPALGPISALEVLAALGRWMEEVDERMSTNRKSG